MKRKIGILICIMLVISMTFAVTSGQNIKNGKNEVANCLENSPPSDPVLTAPDSARKNTIFIIKALSNDPEGDKIYYRFKVGEDSQPRSWDGPFYSGYQFVLRIGLLGYTGDLVIGFQAKDSNGAESDWSYHTTTYTNSKSRSLAFNNIFRLFPILTQIFNL